MPRYIEYMHELSDSIHSLERYDRWVERERRTRNLINQTTAVTPAFNSIFGDNIFLHNSIPRTELGMHSPSGNAYAEATTAGHYGRLNDVFVVHQDNAVMINYFMVQPNLHLLDGPSTFVRTFFRHDDDNSYRVEAVCDSNSQWSLESFSRNIGRGNLRVLVSCLGCGIGGGLDIDN